MDGALPCPDDAENNEENGEAEPFVASAARAPTLAARSTEAVSSSLQAHLTHPNGSGGGGSANVARQAICSSPRDEVEAMGYSLPHTGIQAAYDEHQQQMDEAEAEREKAAAARVPIAGASSAAAQLQRLDTIPLSVPCRPTTEEDDIEEEEEVGVVVVQHATSGSRGGAKQLASAQQHVQPRRDAAAAAGSARSLTHKPKVPQPRGCGGIASLFSHGARACGTNTAAIVVVDSPEEAPGSRAAAAAVVDEIEEGSSSMPQLGQEALRRPPPTAVVRTTAAGPPADELVLLQPLPVTRDIVAAASSTSAAGSARPRPREAPLPGATSLLRLVPVAAPATVATAATAACGRGAAGVSPGAVGAGVSSTLSAISPASVVSGAAALVSPPPDGLQAAASTAALDAAQGIGFAAPAVPTFARRTAGGRSAPAGTAASAVDAGALHAAAASGEGADADARVTRGGSSAAAAVSGGIRGELGRAGRLVFAGTGLASDAEKRALARLAAALGAEMREALPAGWGADAPAPITHVVTALAPAAGAAAPGVRRCKRTLKYLHGVLQGAWVLSVDWVEACVRAR